MAEAKRIIMAKNVFGDNLKVCCEKPMTGFFRNGNCDTSPEDIGMHTVCALMTKEFLEFSLARGNDLSTPIPDSALTGTGRFSGLKVGDKWCICLSRWIEAYQAGMAPAIDLDACHVSVLEHIELEDLKKFAI